MHIYIIEQISKKRKYVGQTTKVNAEDRWKEHLSRLNNKNHWNKFLQRAWDKYGESDFKFYTIQSCNSLDHLNESESAFITALNTMKPRYGFNLRGGGRTNTFSDSSKRKLSIAAKKQWKRQDKKLIGEKISIATKEAMKNLSPEKKAKMIEHVQNTEIKNKISDSIKLLWQDPEYRKRAANKTYHKSPEFKKRQSDRMKEYYRLKRLNTSTT